jgi:multiple sugar transport system permease protein
VETAQITPQERVQTVKSVAERVAQWSEDSAKNVLLLPAILVVLLLSIFPLLVSLYLAFARVEFQRGAPVITWVGTANFAKLLIGSEQRHFLGRFGDINPIGWAIFLAFAAFMIFMYVRYLLSPRRSLFGAILRIVAIVFGGALALLMISTLTTETGLPGTLVVTLIFVFVGVTAQYLLGLGLALLVTQNIPGKRFFRVVFLLPMMITPVGVGFLARMLADTVKGPLAPIWQAIGLGAFSWGDSASGARTVVLLGDIWQWTPFMFIMLLAALEATSREQIEAALVDGATRLSMFRYIILPQILPVSTTLILIRLIEAFKIIDMPNILLGGGPGTATESLTLHAYKYWASLDLGSSAALAYLMLAVVTYVAVVYVNSVRRRLVENL